MIRVMETGNRSADHGAPRRRDRGDRPGDRRGPGRGAFVLTRRCPGRDRGRRRCPARLARPHGDDERECAPLRRSRRGRAGRWRCSSRARAQPLAEARGEVASGSRPAWSAEEATRVYGEWCRRWHANSGSWCCISRSGDGGSRRELPLAMITARSGRRSRRGAPRSSSRPPRLRSRDRVGSLASRPGCHPESSMSSPTRLDVATTLVRRPAGTQGVFTGSTEVGQHDRVSGRPTSRGCRSSSVDTLDDRVRRHRPVGGGRRVLRAKFRNNGQSCIAANRIYVQAGIYDDFCGVHRGGRGSADRLDEGGDGRRGPLIDDAAGGQVQSHVDDAVSAWREAPARRADSRSGPGYTAALRADRFSSVSDEMRVFTEETFGRSAAITSFERRRSVRSGIPSRSPIERRDRRDRPERLLGDTRISSLTDLRRSARRSGAVAGPRSRIRPP